MIPAWEHMLKNLNPNKYNIACIQKPYINPVKLANASNLRQHWDVIYLTDHHTSPKRMQVIMLINRKISKKKMAHDFNQVTERHGDRANGRLWKGVPVQYI